MLRKLHKLEHKLDEIKRMNKDLFENIRMTDQQTFVKDFSSTFPLNSYLALDELEAELLIDKEGVEQLVNTQYLF